MLQADFSCILRRFRHRVTPGDSFPQDSVNCVNFVRELALNLNESAGRD